MEGEVEDDEEEVVEVEVVVVGGEMLFAADDGERADDDIRTDMALRTAKDSSGGAMRMVVMERGR